MRTVLGIAVLFFALGGSIAQAQDRPEVTEQARVGVAWGVGTIVDIARQTAGVEHEQPAPGFVLIPEDPYEDDRGLAREASYFVSVGYAHPIVRYLSLGFEVEFLNWESREDHKLGYGRYNAFDFSFVPRGQLPLVRWAALTLGVPAGLSLNLIDTDAKRYTFEEDASVGYGFDLAILVGALFAFADHWGATIEIGSSWHWFNHTWTYTDLSGAPFEQGREEVQYTTTTFVLRTGVCFLL